MITIENTPNPATLKFQFNFQLPMAAGHEMNSPSEAEISPLAAKIFGFPWTSKIYLGSDFISVTKQEWVDWDVLAEPLKGLIQEHIDSGEPVLMDSLPLTPRGGSEEFDEKDAELVGKIKTILSRDIRPIVAMDGGDIVFAKYADGIVFVRLQGSCSGCPSSTATLKDGVEVRMKELLPEILEVRTV